MENFYCICNWVFSFSLFYYCVFWFKCFSVFKTYVCVTSSSIVFIYGFFPLVLQSYLKFYFFDFSFLSYFFFFFLSFYFKSCLTVCFSFLFLVVQFNWFVLGVGICFIIISVLLPYYIVSGFLIASYFVWRFYADPVTRGWNLYQLDGSIVYVEVSKKVHWVFFHHFQADILKNVNSLSFWLFPNVDRVSYLPNPLTVVFFLSFFLALFSIFSFFFIFTPVVVGFFFFKLILIKLVSLFVSWSFVGFLFIRSFFFICLSNFFLLLLIMISFFFFVFVFKFLLFTRWGLYICFNQSIFKVFYFWGCNFFEIINFYWNSIKFFGQEIIEIGEFFFYEDLEYLSSAYFFNKHFPSVLDW